MAGGKPSTASGEQPSAENSLEPQRSGGSAVLRWRAEPVDVEYVVQQVMPGLLSILIGDLGCRVFCGLTEDLTAWVLRVYSEDKTLALFPRNKEDWSEIVSWVVGPTVIDDVRRYGERTEDKARRSRIR